MKKHLIWFACVLSFALTTCENQQVIHILSAPSELDWLTVIAYAGEYPMPGGSSVEPAFMASVFDYTAYVDKDTTHFVISAGINSEGTVVVYSDQVTGDTATRFDLLGDEAVVTVKATRQYMETTEYRVTVIRGEPVPTAKDVVISVEPGIAAFFIGSGVTPTIKVTAVPPGTGVVLNYQWYVNDQNNTRTGNPITDAEGDSYTMQAIETMAERSVYYYVDITTVMDGKTGMTQSAPCKVTFTNKGRLSEKSVAMVDIPAGTVTAGDDNTWGWNNLDNVIVPWTTPGFKMGRNIVTWELWKFVFDHAEAGNYKFAREGNQGAAFIPINSNSWSVGFTTNDFPEPVGNKLNPVTNIAWRDAVVWCNAYSEMDGLEPVYRDSKGEVLRDSRRAVDALLDFDAMANFNGYRLPTNEEWIYAARGANPAGDHWLDKTPGANSTDFNVLQHYLWGISPLKGVEQQTGEVGLLHPNQLWNGSTYVDGLYDMLGMVCHWVDWPSMQQSNFLTYYKGYDLYSTEDRLGREECIAFVDDASPASAAIVGYGFVFVGFRLARDRN